MSNIFKSKNVEVDFEEFYKKINQANNKIFEFKSEEVSHIKKYHKFIYVLSLIIKKNCDSKSENSCAFLMEIISDLLVNVSLSIKGYLNVSRIIKRRIIENFYNHIYYIDHPIELECLNRGKNDYVPIISLKEYFKSHPQIIDLSDKNIFNYNDFIFLEYQELCKIVHTKGFSYMGLANNLDDVINFDGYIENLISYNDLLSKFIYILYRFHRDLAFTHIEKDLISKCFSKPLRNTLLS